MPCTVTEKGDGVPMQSHGNIYVAALRCKFHVDQRSVMLILYCLLLQCKQHVLPSVDIDDPLQLHTSGHMLRLAFYHSTKHTYTIAMHGTGHSWFTDCTSCLLLDRALYVARAVIVH